jgi:hypothetical protein
MQSHTRAAVEALLKGDTTVTPLERNRMLLLPRFVDLGVPFKSKTMRHPSLGRKWSLKLVLPLFTDLGYGELAIGDGGTASAEFMRVMFTPEGAADRERVRAELEAYCAMDTCALVAILNRLRSLVGDGSGGG